MRRRRLYYGLAAVAVMLCAYLSLWMYSIRWFEGEIDRVYAEAPGNDVRFLGPKPALSNFPFVPEVFYGGGLQIGNAIISFHEMKLRGYPVPGLTLQVSFPSGVSLDGVADPKIWALDELNLDLAIPFSWPRSFAYDDLLRWRDAGGNITVRHYDLVKGPLIAGGDGMLELDDNMQPVFALNTRVRGYEAFIQEQTQRDLIPPFAAAVATAMFNGMATSDEATGEKTIDVAVSVRNRVLQVGSMQLLTLPEFRWDMYRPPAPRQ